MNSQANPEQNSTADSVAITDAVDAQEAIVDAPAAESKPKAKRGAKSAQTARRGATRAKGAAKKKAAPNPKTALPTQNTTLVDLPDLFAAHLGVIGKSDGTVFSYRMELKTAAAFLGEKTKVRTLTAKKVAEYFASDPVTKKRGGKPKSELSIAKTLRVFRQAMTWLVETGVLKSAPLPETK